MNATVRQTVTVQGGGVVHFASPELREGTEAEVIILVATFPEPEHRLAAFQALQQSLAMSPPAADKWIREASGRARSIRSHLTVIADG